MYEYYALNLLTNYEFHTTIKNRILVLSTCLMEKKCLIGALLYIDDEVVRKFLERL